MNDESLMQDPAPDVAGEAAFEALRRGYTAGRLAHAYLVVGDPAGAALALAERVLALLYCEVAGDARPCGRCPGCQRARHRSHPDLLWVEPESKGRLILRDQALAIREHMFRTSLEGAWKVVVVVHADRMNAVAANTLLKTLEEPPTRSLFLLLTGGAGELPPTIVSRCQRLVLPGAAVVEPGLRAAVLDALAEGAGGEEVGMAAGVVRGRRLLAVLRTVRAQVEETVKAESEGALDALEPKAREAMENIVVARTEALYRKQRATVLRLVLHWHRDLFLRACGAGEAALYGRAEAERQRVAAEGLTYGAALANLRAVEELAARLDQNLPEPMVFENAFTPRI